MPIGRPGIVDPSGPSSSVSARLEAPRQAEVEHLHLACVAHDDVAGLDVAVDDALGVGRAERRRDLQRDVHDGRRRQLVARHVGLEVEPVHALHGDERPTLEAVDLVDRADVRVIQLRDGVGFALEAPLGVRVVGGFLGQELQGDFPGQTDVFGLVDDAHAASAELAGDAVVTDCVPEHRGSRGYTYVRSSVQTR